MGPRYDAGYGVLLLSFWAAMVVAFDAPLVPTAWLHDADALSPTVGLVALLVGGVFGLVAATRPETTVAGRRIDHLTFRGLATLAISGLALSSAATSLVDGDRFGLVVASMGVFLVVLGVGTMLRRPTFVSEGDLRTAPNR
jgi:hypothetical protein